MSSVNELIELECRNIRDLLIRKNEAYGNSALEPKRIFSKAGSVEQLRVRIDDKLSRIANQGLNDSHEDTIQDLIGYLILLRVSQRMFAEKMKIQENAR